MPLYAAVATARRAPLTQIDLTAPVRSRHRQRGARRRARSCGRAARGISIPTVGVESLNAAMAAAILLYEARRQRTVKS